MKKLLIYIFTVFLFVACKADFVLSMKAFNNSEVIDLNKLCEKEYDFLIILDEGNYLFQFSGPGLKSFKQLFSRYDRNPELFEEFIQFESAAMADKQHYGGDLGIYKESTEFITVHYTGNMSRGATAYANANYMCSTSSAVTLCSIFSIETPLYFPSLTSGLV